MPYPKIFTTPGVGAFAEQVDAERRRQLDKFGEQHHPDGTAEDAAEHIANTARRECDEAFAAGRGTWAHVLTEEVTEALAESDPARLRTELIQVAAVCAAWVSDLDCRGSAEHGTAE